MQNLTTSSIYVYVKKFVIAQHICHSFCAVFCNKYDCSRVALFGLFCRDLRCLVVFFRDFMWRKIEQH